VVSIRALLIDELGFDPDEPVVAELRSKVIANAAAAISRSGALPGALAGALADALPGALAGALPPAPELRVLRERVVALRRSKDGPVALGNVAQVAAQLGVECVAPAHRDGQAVAVVRTASGRIHVLPDRCPHDGGTISDGHVEGELVVCARHGWEIEACSGRCGRAPDASGDASISASIATFAIRSGPLASSPVASPTDS
jgi:nitrite reductase/ring-hydroxylating ferredoxin subunit